MKRIGIILIFVVAITILASCRSEGKKLHSKDVIVECFSEDETTTVTATSDLEEAPTINVGKTCEISINCEAYKITEVVQDGYWDFDGMYWDREVNFCITHLPKKSCSYSTNVPKEHTYTVGIYLENGEVYYTKITREE